MTFPLTPAAPFTASVSTISATTANAWRTYIARSLDTVDGGAYANTTLISWDAGSAGWTFNGPLTVGATSVFVMTAGGTVTLAADATVSSGGGWDFEGGSLCRFRGTAGGATLQVDDNAIVTCAGDVTWSATSTQTHASSSSDTYSSGSVLTVASGAVATFNLGGVSAAGVTFIGANGSAVWNGASTATWQTSSTATWNSGSTLTISSGCIFTGTIGGGAAVGSLTVGATGTVTYQATSNIVHAASSIDTYSASSSKIDASTTTRSGPTTLSGTSAWKALRIAPGVDATPTNVDGREQDILVVTTLTADPTTYVLIDLGASQTLSFKIRVSTDKGLIVKRAGGGATLYTFYVTAGSSKTIEFYWNGTLWKLGVVGAEEIEV